MNKFSACIINLNTEIKNSIKNILANNRIEHMDIREAYDSTYVVWWCEKGYLYEGKVLRILYDGESLSMDVDDQGDAITLYEDAFAFENPIWMDAIRTAMLDVLKEKHGHVCEECGKPLTEGFNLHTENADYCSGQCLYRNYSPEQWLTMQKDPLNRWVAFSEPD